MRILQLVNSVCINPDKMMMVNLDCTILWVDNQEVLTKSFEENPTYLKDDFRGMPEYWVKVEHIPKQKIPGIETLVRNPHVRSERFKEIYSTREFYQLNTYARFMVLLLKCHLKAVSRSQHAKMAQVFEMLISSDDRFEVTNDVRFGLVCFRLKVIICALLTEILFSLYGKHYVA
ncbi:uncharacterized protein DEA37_0015134 [Paragonimus westermani]|uniref:Aromatic-L-amino-acid decarboxylase n=1 Tax=Paragonimus westermani TaxID=34504 RepID=A0A5J4NPV1_9TREM|nr:uncharacterized protein DEA37_0015134 [Paragonimus westermani]